MPNAIGIGMPKCSTGTLAFLDCHPNIAFRAAEPSFFTKSDYIIEAWRSDDKAELLKLRYEYTKKLPQASPDEFLIEKSPQYMNPAPAAKMLERAWAMKIINPSVKIIFHHCDPIKRMYSMFRMEERRTEDYKAKGRNKRKCRACLKQPIEMALAKWATKKNSRRTGFRLSEELAPWRRVFDDSQIFIVDGERMAHDAENEMARLLEFLEVPAQTFSFNNQPDKGFSCLQQPLPYCLNPAKGTSRKSSVYETFPNISKVALKGTKKEMSCNLPLLGFSNFAEQRDFCRRNTSERFDWYRPFVCPVSRFNDCKHQQQRTRENTREYKIAEHHLDRFLLGSKDLYTLQMKPFVDEHANQMTIGGETFSISYGNDFAPPVDYNIDDLLRAMKKERKLREREQSTKTVWTVTVISLSVLLGLVFVFFVVKRLRPTAN